MRNVLFSHNGPLYRGRDGSMYGMHFTEAVKQRYLALGDRVTVIMREATIDGPLERYSKIEEQDFDFVRVPNILSPRDRIANHAAAMRRIRTAVESADVVVARIPSLISRLVVYESIKQGKPYMIECVACNWDALWNHRWKAKLGAPWYFLMQRRVVWRSPHVVYVTDRFLQRRYPTKGEHVAISNVELEDTPDAVLEHRL
jgi:hypothetical protein